MIARLVKKIAGLSGTEFSPVVFKPRLEEITDKLPRVPTDLQEYLYDCLLSESYGDQIELHGYERLLEENDALVPGAETIKQGFLCIAKEPDGSQFAYNCTDKRIYHISEEAGVSPEATIEEAYGCWDSLVQFLEECIQLAKNPDKPIQS